MSSRLVRDDHISHQPCIHSSLLEELEAMGVEPIRPVPRSDPLMRSLVAIDCRNLALSRPPPNCKLVKYQTGACVAIFILVFQDLE
jgi:hypothetical protein